MVDYNAFDHHTVVDSAVEVPVGDSELVVQFRRTGRSQGAVELFVDGTAAGIAPLPLFMSMISSVGASVGYDHGSAVSARYEAPFEFAGVLHDVTIQLLTRAEADASAEQAAARAGMARQ